MAMNVSPIASVLHLVMMTAVLTLVPTHAEAKKLASQSHPFQKDKKPMTPVNGTTLHTTQHVSQKLQRNQKRRRKKMKIPQT
jgi:hypothetical protein